MVANWRSSCDNGSSEPTLRSWSRGSASQEIVSVASQGVYFTCTSCVPSC